MKTSKLNFNQQQQVLLFLLMVTSMLFIPFLSTSLVAQEKKTSIYDYTVTDINGESFSFESLRGKKIMIVNVASACGLTPQYETLQEIYKMYKERGFEIVGFPCNDFKEQESGTNEEIKEFCTLNYGVSFPMMDKIVVKGDKKAPIYQWLTTKELNNKDNYSVSWNFQKFLINRDGTLYKVFSPMTKPDNSEIIEWITAAE
ncbi:MAG: glutathione peroxidase [Phocaeicola sp.]